MLFQIGSMTKMFTAAELVTLAEEGKVKLDAPIGDYVEGTSPALARITAHQLLSQTSGIVDQPAEYGSQDESALADFVHSWKESEYCLLPPGRIFSYSNPGYSLAGFLVQQVGGKSYADLMVESVFKPLGMNQTTFRPTVAMTFPIAVGHSESEQKKLVVVRPFAQDTRYLPAGYIYTSIDDLSRFAIAFVNDGKLDGKEVLHPDVIRKMSQSYIDIPTDPVWIDSRYGYGLFLHMYRGVKLLEHVGSMPGFVAEIWMVPEKKGAVIVLANKEGRPFTKTMDKALELLTTLQTIDSPRPKPNIPITEQEMNQYAGTYHNRWDVEVAVRDGKLILKRFGSEIELSKVGPNRFSMPASNGKSEEILIFPSASDSPGFLQMFIWGFKKQ